MEFRLDDAKGTSRSLTPLAVPAQVDKDEVDPFPDLSTKQIRKVKQTARTGFSRGGKLGPSEEGLDLGTGGHADGGRRTGDVTGGELREEEEAIPPKSMQELLWSRVQWGEKSILNFDAPMGGGPVARIEVRLDDGKDVAYWACRLTLATGERSAPDISVLVIVAEDGGARDNTEMMLFKVRSMEEITPSKCARLASAFWTDDQSREALEDDGVLVGALTKERLATEHGGIALTVIVDRLVNPAEMAEVVPERPRVRAV